MKLKEFFEDIYLDVALAVIAFVYIIFNWQDDLVHFIGMSLAFFSLIFWIIARFHLGKAFSVKPEAKKLITTGLYSKIRNPMYIFSSLVFLGIIIALNEIYFYPLFLILIIAQFNRAQKEKMILEEKFGQEYLEYKKNTWF